ncbi:MAG: MFS transporter [Elusimicrobia bacterium]|nr:MFS transporter [Elusimicrobiota bacterium]
MTVAERVTGSIKSNRPPASARPHHSRATWAWAFYDFANSPFSTTVVSVVFNVYYAKVVAQDAGFPGDTLWGYLVAAATLASAVCSPVLGAFADKRQVRKPLLACFAILGGAATIGLTWSQEGTLLLSSALYFVASLSFSCSLAFYNAFLNDLSTEETIGRISGLGWALGYIGSGLCLAVNLLMIEKPGALGLPTDAHWPVRLTFAMCGIWWIVFTLPILFWVPERRHGNALLGRAAWAAALTGVKKSLATARTANKNLFRYLIAYLLYNDGIETAIVMAGVFASEILSMGQGEIVGCFLMIQFVAFFGALGFGRLGDRWGNKKALQLSLTLWAIVLGWAVIMQTKTEFWMASAAIAVVLGGSQSLSRSLFGKLIPQGSEAEFYGFLNLSSKVSATLGPLTYGLSRQLTGSPRIGILSMLIFFALGQALLVGVREPGRKIMEETPA